MKSFFALSGLLIWAAQASAAATQTVTLSFPAVKTDRPEVVWKGLHFESGKQVDAPELGAKTWHIRFKQACTGTNQGKVLAIDTSKFYDRSGRYLADQAFDSVKEAPKDLNGFVADTKLNPGGPPPEDLYNKPMMDGLEYNMWFMLRGHHLFSIVPKLYLVATPDGHIAKVQFVDYVSNGHAIRYEDGNARDGDAYVAKVREPDAKVYLTVRYQVLK